MLVHFACHSTTGDTGASTQHYRIRVRREELVGTSWLKREILTRMPEIGQLKGPSYRLLFLNICRSLRRTGTTDRSPGHALDRLGADAVIGLLGEICDIVAAEFAAKFYDEVFTGVKTVGESFLHSLRHRLEVSQNPAHLLFVLKGLPDVRLV
jgi:hypothetical protein